MARIRTIKPEFWTDEKIVQLPYEARLLFIGIWNFADDHGCLWDEPERIRMQVLPNDAVDISGLLDLLCASGLLEVYESSDEKRIFRVTHFNDHQKVDHPTPSKIPRESSRKLSIPNNVRRAIAKKYGCVPGGSNKAVFLDVNNDLQFVYDKDATGKQVRVPYTGPVDQTISKVTATATSAGSKKGAEAIAELDSKRLNAAQVASGKAVEQAGLLQELLKTPQPISGSGAPARVGALRVFSTFGLTSPKDDEALGNADKFNALAGERVISFIKALGSNPTDTDREFARTIGPALEKGTKTNTDLINFLLERSRKVVKDADSLETHFYNNNYSLRGYKSPFLTDLETPKSKASDLTTEELQRIARGKK